MACLGNISTMNLIGSEKYAKMTIPNVSKKRGGLDYIGEIISGGLYGKKGTAFRIELLFVM